VRVRNVLVMCLYVFKKENRKLMLFLEGLLLVPCVCLLSFLEHFVVCVSVSCVCVTLTGCELHLTDRQRFERNPSQVLSVYSQHALHFTASLFSDIF